MARKQCNCNRSKWDQRSINNCASTLQIDHQHKIDIEMSKKRLKVSNSGFVTDHVTM